MKYPHQHLLQYLAILFDDDAMVGRILAMDDLLVPDAAEMTRIRHDLADRPTGFTWMDAAHRESQQWLADKKLKSLFAATSAASEAFRILRSPTLRQPVEMLLLGGIGNSSVVTFVREHGLGELSSDGVATYAHYLWDCASMTLTDWVAFLDRHPHGDAYLPLLTATPEQVQETVRVLVSRHGKARILSTARGPGIQNRQFDSTVEGV